MTYDDAMAAAHNGASVRRAAWPGGRYAFEAGPNAPRRTRSTMWGLMVVQDDATTAAPIQYEPVPQADIDASDWSVL